MASVLDPKSETEMRIRIVHALNVRRGMLEDIEKWGGDSFQISDIRGTCKDDSIRNFSTFGELADYKNDPDGELCALEFSMKDIQGNRVYSEIGNETNFFIRSKSAYFRVVGTDDICIQLRSDIYRDMKSYRPWYWPLAWVTFDTLMVAYWVLVSLYFALRIMGLIEFETASDASVSLNTTLFAAVLLIPVVWCFIRLANFLKKHLFPSVTFSIGHGKSRDEIREWVRRFLVGTTVLSMLAVLGSLFS